tara:strand:+ start:9512 stop:9730 length:219 start_codon:yes stop_codon:yes gene_type:complete
MSNIKKLTPKLLQKLIREEKQRLFEEKKESIAQKEANKDETIASLAIQEVRHLLKIKKIREQRRILRNKRKK